MKQSELAILMNTSTRGIRDLVHRIREKGFGIVSDKNGLHITTSWSLKYGMAQILIKRAKSMLDAAAGLMRYDQEDLTEREKILVELLPEKQGPDGEESMEIVEETVQEYRSTRRQLYEVESRAEKFRADHAPGQVTFDFIKENGR